MPKNKFHLRDVILSAIGPMLVDTCFVFDGNRYESLVVKCDSDGKPYWGNEFDCLSWSTEESAREGHSKLIEKWEV